MSDAATLTGVLDGSAYRALRAKQSALMNQGADIRAELLRTTNPARVAVLNRAMSENQAAKNAMQEQFGAYNKLADLIRTYSVGAFNPPSLSGLAGLGVFPLAIPAAVKALLAIGAITAAVAVFYSIGTRLDQHFSAAASLLREAGSIPVKLAEGAQGAVSAASGAVDVMAKMGLYAGIGFAAYLAYEAYKSRRRA